jgi:hypothetical protein
MGPVRRQQDQHLGEPVPLIGTGASVVTAGWGHIVAVTPMIERHRPTNPPVPGWLDEDYREAWREALRLAIAD